MSNIHAVVKATYTKSGKAAKASVRYFAHRIDREGNRTTREIFNQHGLISKKQAYRMIDQTRGNAYFYRIIISPERSTGEKRDLPQITRQTMRKLQTILKASKPLPFIAVAHTDHSDTPHVHALAVLRTYLNDAALTKLREACEGVVLTRYPENQARNNQAQAKTSGRSPLMLRARPSRWQRYSMPIRQDIFIANPRGSLVEGQARGGGGGIAHAPRKLFICPGCNQPSKLKKTDNYFECKRCGMEIGRRSNRHIFAQREGRQSYN